MPDTNGRTQLRTDLMLLRANWRKIKATGRAPANQPAFIRQIATVSTAAKLTLARNGNSSPPAQCNCF